MFELVGGAASHQAEARKRSVGSSDGAGIAGVGVGRGNVAGGAVAAADNTAVVGAVVDIAVAAAAEDTYSRSGSSARDV